LLKQKTSNKLQTKKIIGPGKVCRELKIDKSFNGADLIKNNRLYFVRVVNNRVADSPLFPLCYRSRFGGQACCPLVKIKKLPRVGVDYAKAYKDKKWRFVLFENRKS